MTRAEFLEALASAIRAVQPTLLSGPEYWPRGRYLRFLVVRGSSEPDLLPPVVDPIGLVWYHRTRTLRGPLDSLKVADVLGLEIAETAALIQAADGRGGDVEILAEYQQLCHRLRP